MKHEIAKLFDLINSESMLSTVKCTLVFGIVKKTIIRLKLINIIDIFSVYSSRIPLSLSLPAFELENYKS